MLSSFDASQVTPPYRAGELSQGVGGIEGIGFGKQEALKSIGITTKGELLYLHKFVCNDDMKTTGEFLRVRTEVDKLLGPCVCVLCYNAFV